MAKISAKGAVITVAATDISKYCDSYDIEWAQQTDEVTGFTDGWKNYIAGIPVVSLTLDVYWDKTVSTGTFAKFVALMSTPGTVSIVPENSGPTISGTFLCSGVKPGGKSSSGAIVLGSISLLPSGSTVGTFA